MCVQSVFRVCLGCVRNIFRVCLDCVQSVFRVFSECVHSVFRVCSILTSFHHLPHLVCQFLAFLLATRILPASPNFEQAKRPRSHCLSTMHLLPYMWASFYPLDPSRYLFSFSSWRPKTKKFPFFTNFHGHLQKKFVGLLRTQF